MSENHSPRFLFLGNQLALDFVNTRPVVDGEPRELLPDFASLLDWFSASGVLERNKVAALRGRWRDEDKNESVRQRLLAFREELRSEVLHWENSGRIRPRIIEKVNDLMARFPMLSRMQQNQQGYSVEDWFDPKNPEHLFAPLARAAANLFAHSEKGKVRKCEHCVLHFVDTSKKGSRRWCSMQYCGNRAKVAAYADRRRGKS